MKSPVKTRLSQHKIVGTLLVQRIRLRKRADSKHTSEYTTICKNNCVDMHQYVKVAAQCPRTFNSYHSSALHYLKVSRRSEHRNGQMIEETAEKHDGPSHFPRGLAENRRQPRQTTDVPPPVAIWRAEGHPFCPEISSADSTVHPARSNVSGSCAAAGAAAAVNWCSCCYCCC